MVHPLITLFPPNATEFDTNGLGSLAEAESCIITEEANGEFELEMVYPVSGKRFSDLENRSIIFTKPNPYTAPQAFRVYKISKPMNGMITYYAAHISYDLSGVPIDPFEANSCSEALLGLKEHSMVTHPFTFWTDNDKSGYFWPLVPKSARSLLGGSSDSISTIYGGDFEFDNFEVKLHQNRGKDSGVSIRYGKNLTDINQEEDGSTAYSGVLPYWADTSTEELVMLSGDPIIPTPGTHNYTNVLSLDLTSELEAAPTDEELREAAEKYIEENGLGVPTINIDVSFVQLEQTDEYQEYALLENVNLFDRVTVVYPKLGVSATAKVITTVYDAIRGRYESVTLGDARANLSDTVASQGNAAEEAVAKMSSAIENATKWITNGKGYMVAIRDAAGNWTEICSLDSPDLTKAMNVWRWNNGGFGHSSTGYNGPYTLAITQDGKIVADFITTGTMKADRIRGGTLEMGGENDVNGAIIMRDGNGEEIGRWDNEQLTITKGVFRTKDYSKPSDFSSYSTKGWSFDIEKGSFKSESFSFGISIPEGTETTAYQGSQNVLKNIWLYDGVENDVPEKSRLIWMDSSAIAYYKITNQTQPNGNYLYGPYAQIALWDWVYEPNALGLNFQSNNQIIFAKADFPSGGGYPYLVIDFTGANQYKGEAPIKFYYAVQVANGGLYLSHTANDGGTTASVSIVWDDALSAGSLESNYYIRTYENRIITGTDFYTYGNIGCSGQKSRIVDTEHYGIIGLYANETPSPYFTDLGSATIAEDGTIRIIFDEKFAETVDLRCEYQVFLTRTSEKEVYWVDKQSGYFVVHGEAGATFDWMLSVPQRDYSSTRMESALSAFPRPDIAFEDSIFYDDDKAIEVLNEDFENYEKEIDLL